MVVIMRTPRSWMTWTRRTRRIPTTASRSTPWPFRVEPRRASTSPTRPKNYLYSAPPQRMLTSSVTRRAGRPQPPRSPRVASWLPSLPMDGLVRKGRLGVDIPSPATARRRVPEMGLESSQLHQPLPKQTRARSLITLERRRSGHGGRHLHRHRRRRRAEVP